MTVAAPDPRFPVDWDGLLSLSDEVERLLDAGALDRASFKRIWDEAAKACPGNLGLRESLAMFAKPGWIDVTDEG